MLLYVCPKNATKYWKGEGLYKCNNCGETMKKPKQRLFGRETEGFFFCGCCGSEDITESKENCGLCGRALYRGETAYETEKTLICGKCITTVEI